jgi:5'-deoxynucleotidase YfbR-like HD superfamily hydrolase
MQDIDGILEFLFKIGKLKGLPRTGWVEQGIEDPESVADHSYRTTFLTLLLADLDGLDSGKATKMALLHDISEAVTGDLTPGMKSQKGIGYQIEEREAIEKLFFTLPRELALEYKLLWEELRIGSSPEAKIVMQADKLEMKIQALEYEQRGGDASRLDRFWHSMNFDGLALDLFQQLQKKRESKCIQS